MTIPFDKERFYQLKKGDKTVKQKQTIMIVDDEENMLKSLESLFSDNYNVITARDGKEALEIIDDMEYPEDISVIIADQRMPGLTGVELLIQLKDIIPETIRIILTAFDDKDVVMQAFKEAKIYQFILKGYDNDELKIRIENAVEAFELQQKVIVAGYTDYLTGMYNRRYLYENIDSHFEIKSKEDFNIISGGNRKAVLSNNNRTFILLDLDNFKEINDNYGHSTGDDVLQQFAGILNKEFRISDLIVRWGGDEFLMVLKYSSLDQVGELCGRFCREVNKNPFNLGNKKTTHLTCSIGFACYPFLQAQPDLFTWEEVFDIADIALYAAKYSGRNAWAGLSSTDKTKPGNLYQETEKGKKKMLPNIEGLLENGEMDITTSLPDKKSITWRKMISASGGQGGSFRENRPPGPPAKAFD